MAFVCEKIEIVEDKEYFKSIGFTDITAISFSILEKLVKSMISED